VAAAGTEATVLAVHSPVADAGRARVIPGHATVSNAFYHRIKDEGVCVCLLQRVPKGFMVYGYFLFLQEQIKDIIIYPL